MIHVDVSIIISTIEYYRKGLLFKSPFFLCQGEGGGTCRLISNLSMIAKIKEVQGETKKWNTMKTMPVRVVADSKKKILC